MIADSSATSTAGPANVLTALWTAESPCVTAVAQCRDGAAHAVAVCAGPGASGAATARRRGAGGLESAPRDADQAAARPERHGLATLLRTMHSPVPMSELQRQAGGLSDGELSDLSDNW